MCVVSYNLVYEVLGCPLGVHVYFFFFFFVGKMCCRYSIVYGFKGLVYVYLVDFWVGFHVEGVFNLVAYCSSCVGGDDDDDGGDLPP